jgi:thiol-disulfide isomerase/thioredoxin
MRWDFRLVDGSYAAKCQKSPTSNRMKGRKLAIQILLAAFALLVIMKLYGYSAEGFEASGNELIIAKADWCGHCKKAKPAFDALAAASPIKLSDGSSVTVRILDADANKADIEKLNVRGFPSIIYMKGGNPMEYSGERSYDGVISFLNSA